LCKRTRVLLPPCTLHGNGAAWLANGGLFSAHDTVLGQALGCPQHRSGSRWGTCSAVHTRAAAGACVLAAAGTRARAPPAAWARKAQRP
jgi:hypothetical protein